MSNKLLVTVIASLLTLSMAAHAPAQTIKKKKVVKPAQSEQDAGKEVMDALVLGVATGMLTGAMKKGKMPKGGKIFMKHGLKAVKESAKKSKDGGKKDSGGKDTLKILFGG